MDFIFLWIFVALLFLAIFLFTEKLFGDKEDDDDTN